VIPQSPVLRGAVYALGGMGLYSLYDMTIKFLGKGYSPVQVLFCAGLVYLPLILTHLAITGQAGRMWPVLPGWTALRSASALVNGVLGAYAFSVLPLAQAYAVFFLMPLMIALLAVPMLGERLDAARGLAILVGFAGVVVALDPERAAPGPGHLAALAAAGLGAMNYVILRRTGAVESPGVLLLYPAGVQLAAVALAMPALWVPMTGQAWLLTSLMGAQVFLGGLLIIAAYRLAPAIVVAPMQYSQILWAAVLGAVVFGEAMTTRTIAGISIIIAAGLFILWRSSGANGRAG
jgi:S-adenosylmethionine uptake transporter